MRRKWRRGSCLIAVSFLVVVFLRYVLPPVATTLVNNLRAMYLSFALYFVPMFLTLVFYTFHFTSFIFSIF
jgi:hypothetical protein